MLLLFIPLDTHFITSGVKWKQWSCVIFGVLRTSAVVTWYRWVFTQIFIPLWVQGGTINCAAPSDNVIFHLPLVNKTSSCQSQHTQTIEWNKWLLQTVQWMATWRILQDHKTIKIRDWCLLGYGCLVLVLHLTLWFYIDDCKRVEDQQYHNSSCHTSLVKIWEMYHSLTTNCYF